MRLKLYNLILFTVIFLVLHSNLALAQTITEESERDIPRYILYDENFPFSKLDGYTSGIDFQHYMDYQLNYTFSLEILELNGDTDAGFGVINAYIFVIVNNETSIDLSINLMLNDYNFQIIVLVNITTLDFNWISINNEKFLVPDSTWTLLEKPRIRDIILTRKNPIDKSMIMAGHNCLSLNYTVNYDILSHYQSVVDNYTPSNELLFPLQLSLIIPIIIKRQLT